MPVNGARQGVDFCSEARQLLRVGLQNARDATPVAALGRERNRASERALFAGMARSQGMFCSRYREFASDSHPSRTLCKLTDRVRGPERRSCRAR